MSHPAIGRFFSPLQALISVGIGCGGLLCGAIVTYRYLDAHRISIMFVLLTLALLAISPIYFVVQAFPQGCKACRRAFATKSAIFPVDWKDAVRRFLAAPDQTAWQQLCQAPWPNQSYRALLSIEHCSSCGRIGQAQLTTEVARNGDWSTQELVEERVVEAPILSWLVQLADARGGQSDR